MAYTDRIAQRDCAVRFLVRISGVRTVFVNFTVPSAWLGSGGLELPKTNGGVGFDVHLVSPTLLVQKRTAISDASQELRPKSGTPKAGSFDLEMILIGGTSGIPSLDTWRDQLTGTVERGDATSTTKRVGYLTQDYDADATAALKVLDNPFSGGGGPRDLYLGFETLSAGDGGGMGGSELIGPVNERGIYGSQALNHFATIQVGSGESIPNGARVSDYVRTLEGRYCDVYAISGWIDSETRAFVPYGALDTDGVQGGEHARVMTGILSQVREEKSDRVQLKIQSLHSMFRRQLMQRVPRGRVGGRSVGHIPPRIYVGPHNRTISFQMTVRHPIYYNILTFQPGNLTDGDTVTFGVDASQVTMTARTAPVGANEFGITGSPRDNFRVAVNALTNVSWVVFDASNSDIATVIYDAAAGHRQTASVNVTTAGAMAWGEPTFSGLSTIDRRGVVLVDPDPPFNPLSFGLHTANTIRRSIQATISQQLPDSLIAMAELTSSPGTAPVDGGIAIPLTLLDLIGLPNTDSLGATGALAGRFTLLDGRVSWRFFPHHENRVESITVYLGAMETLDAEEAEDIGTGGTRLYYAALVPEDPIPSFYWPAEGFEAPDRVYLRDVDDWSKTWFNYDLKWVDDDAQLIDRHAIIEGVELISYNTRVTVSDSLSYLQSVGRVDGVAHARERVVINPTDEQPEVRCAPYFPGVSWPRMVLYALLGGSGVGEQGSFDRGWPGCGAYIRPDLVDADAFQASRARFDQIRHNWAWLEGDKIEDVLRDESVLTNQQIITGADGRLTIISMDPPAESELVVFASSIRQLTESNTRIPAASGGKHRRPARWVCNVARAKYGFNNATGDYEREPIIVRRPDSSADYGEQDTVEIEVRGMWGAGEVEIARAALQRLLNLFAEKYSAFDVPLTRREAWGWQTGDVAALTHSQITIPDTPGVGVTDLPARIVELRRHFKPRARRGQATYADATVVSYAYQGRRTAYWGPSCQITHDSGNDWDTVDHAYSTGDQPVDISLFAAGDLVKVSPLGEHASITQATIQSVDAVGGSVTFLAALPFTSPAVVWFDDYDAALQDRQRAFVALAGTDGKITKPGGTDPAFRLL